MTQREFSTWQRGHGNDIFFPRLFKGRICTLCSQPSPHVYDEGWLCLVPTCKAFWAFPLDLDRFTAPSEESRPGRLGPGLGPPRTPTTSMSKTTAAAAAQTWLPIPPNFSLSYSPGFLVAARTPSDVGAVPYDVVPPPPQAGAAETGDSGDMEGEDLGSRTLWRGQLQNGAAAS
jgi:hypothetical protein